MHSCGFISRIERDLGSRAPKIDCSKSLTGRSSCKYPKIDCSVSINTAQPYIHSIWSLHDSEHEYKVGSKISQQLDLGSNKFSQSKNSFILKCDIGFRIVA